MKHIFSKHILQPLGVWVLLGLFLALANPEKLPVSIVIVPFILVLIGLWLSWTGFCVQVFGTSTSVIARNMRQFGHIMSVALTFCLALQSLGQLSVRDVLAVLLVCMLGYFYVQRMWFDVR